MTRRMVDMDMDISLRRTLEKLSWQVDDVSWERAPYIYVCTTTCHVMNQTRHARCGIYLLYHDMP